jgi:chromosome segregation ATPase
MQTDGGKIDSLHWAIEELSKQKNELDDKLKIARKREETGALIEEVNAQKLALDQRIAALEDGLKVSSNLVDTPVDFLEEEISTVNDKLEIAQERLESLEQEQYLEELGKKLNRSHEEDSTENIILPEEVSPHDEPFSLASPSTISSSESLDKGISTSTQTMTTPISRIGTEEQQATSRLPQEEATEHEPSIAIQKDISPVPVEGLEETAAKLGVEPEFLVEKGTKALLRMIARNGRKSEIPP